MTDLEKIVYLQEIGYLKLEDTELYNNLVKESVKKLFVGSLGNLSEEELKSFEKLVDDEYQINYKSFSHSFDDELKKYELTHKIQFKTDIEEIETFVREKTIKKRGKSKKFINGQGYILAIKKALSKLSNNVNIRALEAKSQNEFDGFLEESIEDIEVYDNQFSFFKLEYQLERKRYNNFIKHIGDFQESYVIPDFIKNIESINIKKKTIKKTLFIEGESGSGKTTFAQNIAYYLKGTNIYYVDLKESDSTLLEKNIDLFLDEVLINKAVLLLDNIHISNFTLYIAQIFFLKITELEIPSIFIFQKYIFDFDETIKTFDKLFNDSHIQHLKSSVVLIDIAKKEKSLILIQDLLHFHNEKFNKEYKINKANIENLYQIFGANITKINYSLKRSQKLCEITEVKFKKDIRKDYKELLSIDSYQELKLILLYLSSYDYPFTIEESIFDKFDIFEELFENNLLYKFYSQNKVTISFPHNAIAKYIIELIVEERNENIYNIIIDNFQHIRLLDPILYEIFIECLYYKIDSHHKFIEIFNCITNNIKPSKVVTLYSLRLVLQKSFKCNIKCLNQSIYSKEFTRDIESNDNILLDIKGKDEFTKIITKENIQSSIDDIKYWAKLRFDSCYDYLLEKILNIILNENIPLKLEDWLDIDFDLSSNNKLREFNKYILSEKLNNFKPKDYELIEDVEKVILKINRSRNNDVKAFLHEKMYLIFRYKNFLLKDILILLNKIYKHISKEIFFSGVPILNFENLVEDIDNNCYKYLTNNDSLFNNDFKEIIPLLQSEYSSVSIFQKTSNSICKYIFSNHHIDSLIFVLNNLENEKLLYFANFLSQINNEYYLSIFDEMIMTEVELKGSLKFGYELISLINGLKTLAFKNKAINLINFRNDKIFLPNTDIVIEFSLFIDYLFHTKHQKFQYFFKRYTQLVNSYIANIGLLIPDSIEKRRGAGFIIISYLARVYKYKLKYDFLNKFIITEYLNFCIEYITCINLEYANKIVNYEILHKSNNIHLYLATYNLLTMTISEEQEDFLLPKSNILDNENIYTITIKDFIEYLKINHSKFEEFLVQLNLHNLTLEEISDITLHISIPHEQYNDLTLLLNHN